MWLTGRHARVRIVRHSDPQIIVGVLDSDNLTIKMSSQKGQPKKKKPRLLPTLDHELHSQRGADKAIATVIKTAVDRMRDTDNVTSVERLRDLHPDNILVWLIAKHGSTTIFSLMKAFHSLPNSLTEC